jgi:hypothetical protein
MGSPAVTGKNERQQAIFALVTPAQVALWFLLDHGRLRELRGSVPASCSGTMREGTPISKKIQDGCRKIQEQ